MKIGIISDTHDQVPEIKKAIRMLRDEHIDLLLHAGDWVSAFTLEHYRDISCPIRGVWGNNVGDLRFPALAKKIGLDLEINEEYSCEYDGIRILIVHELNATRPRENQDVIIYGHDHKAKIEETGGVLCINPGTLLRETFPWLITKPSIAIYDTASREAKLLYLDN